MRHRRIGVASLGLVLIGSGLAMLWSSTTGRTLDLTPYWPVVLVLLGGEMLIAHARARTAGHSVRIGLSGWVLLALVLVLILGRGASGTWIIGCNPELGWGPAGPSHRVSRPVQLQLDPHGIRTVEVATRFGRIDMSTVAPGAEPRGEALITGSATTSGQAEKAAAGAGVTVQRDGSRLTVRATGEHSDGRTVNTVVDLVLLLPSDIEIRVTSEFGDITVAGLVGSVAVTARFGDVSLSSITGPVTVETEHGDLDAVRIRGPLSVRSTHGDVGCDDIAGPLEVVSRHGAVSIRRAHDRVKVSNTYRPVSIYYDVAPPAPCEVTTVHGQITLEMPSHSAVTVDALSERSGVWTNLAGLSVRAEGRGNRALGNANGGGPQIKLRTEYARIDIRGR